MHITLVNIHVKTDHIEDFIQATRDNHKASVQEADNLRFDVLQNESDPSRFVLYEAYANAAAAAAHKQTSHYLGWRDAVSEWMATPREGVRYHAIEPDKRELW